MNNLFKEINILITFPRKLVFIIFLFVYQKINNFIINKYLFMGDTDLGLYEEYLLESREQVINKLIKGTDSYNYFTFVGLL